MIKLSKILREIRVVQPIRNSQDLAKFCNNNKAEIIEKTGAYLEGGDSEDFKPIYDSYLSDMDDDSLPLGEFDKYKDKICIGGDELATCHISMVKLPEELEKTLCGGEDSWQGTNNWEEYEINGIKLYISPYILDPGS